FLHCSPDCPVLHSFPTRRSSDLLHYAIFLAPWYAILPAVLIAALLPHRGVTAIAVPAALGAIAIALLAVRAPSLADRHAERTPRSEEHTSELQSRSDLVCRLLLE